jgi:hypothetical protein
VQSSIQNAQQAKHRQHRAKQHKTPPSGEKVQQFQGFSKISVEQNRETVYTVGKYSQRVFLPNEFLSKGAFL